MITDKEYDIIIIGGGIVGTALLYVLSKYTDIEKIAIIEKYNKFGQVNSYRNNNSQTLHCGDIETNYKIEKARKVNNAALMLKNYLEKYGKETYTKLSKMVLALGEKESEILKKRYREFKKFYPNIKLINKEKIEDLEPMVIKDRNKDEILIAIYNEDGYAINFDLLSESFVKEAKKSKSIEIKLGEKVKKILKKKDYTIVTNKNSYKSKFVVVCAGSHSLIFAKSLNYGKEFGILPVAGSFFGTKKKFLNGKVYTIQMEKLPFAAIHGDPYVDNLNETRFGPTAKVLPLLERHNYATIFDFLKTSVWNIKGMISLFKIFSDPVIFRYALKNLTYDIPTIGKRIFIKEVRKIVPSIKSEDLEFKKGYGGIRPQIVDWKKMMLEMGDAKIYGKNIIFNVTPSPGASVCLKNAELDAKKIIESFKKNLNIKIKFYERKFNMELVKKGRNN